MKHLDNIYFSSNPAENFTVKSTFTGKIGLTVNNPKEGLVVGITDGVAFAAGSLMPDQLPDYRIVVKGDRLILTAAASGDMDGNGKLNTDDAVYLLLHIMFGQEDYPISAANKDMDGNSKLNTDDAVYLLLHTMFGAEDYPL